LQNFGTKSVEVGLYTKAKKNYSIKFSICVHISED